MTDTPAQQMKAIGRKVMGSLTPETRIAVPAILLCGLAWWVLQNIRERDLDRINAAQEAARKESGAADEAMRKDISAALESTQYNKNRYDDLIIRISRSEISAQYTGNSLAEMKGDIKGILVEIRQMRQEAKP